MTTQLLRAFDVCRDLAEAGFNMQRSHSYLTTGRVFPLSILLGLMFSGTHFEEVWSAESMGSPGSSVGS